jgi:hypothetical protein
VQDLFDEEFGGHPSHDYAYTLMEYATEEIASPYTINSSFYQLSVDAQAASSRIIEQAIDSEMGVTLIPTVDMTQRRLNEFTKGLGTALEDLLDKERLFILDMVGGCHTNHRNIFDVQREDAGIKYLLQMIDDRSEGDSQLSIFNTEAKTHALGMETARELRYWQEANHIDRDDVLLDIHNPEVMDDELAAFHVDAAQQVIRTWLGSSGLQYVTVKKSPTGHIGSSRVVEYIDEPPYVRVEPP